MKESSDTPFKKIAHRLANAIEILLLNSGKMQPRGLYIGKYLPPSWGGEGKYQLMSFGGKI
jgi:hypothetical protein